jgi:hypothetical protein
MAAGFACGANTLQQPGQSGIGDAVEDRTTVPATRQQSMPTEQTQVLARLMVGQFTQIGDFVDGEGPSGEDVNHPQSHGVPEEFQAIGGVSQK